MQKTVTKFVFFSSIIFATKQPLLVWAINESRQPTKWIDALQTDFSRLRNTKKKCAIHRNSEGSSHYCTIIRSPHCWFMMLLSGALAGNCGNDFLANYYCILQFGSCIFAICLDISSAHILTRRFNYIRKSAIPLFFHLIFRLSQRTTVVAKIAFIHRSKYWHSEAVTSSHIVGQGQLCGNLPMSVQLYVGLVATNAINATRMNYDSEYQMHGMLFCGNTLWNIHFECAWYHIRFY